MSSDPTEDFVSYECLNGQVSG